MKRTGEILKKERESQGLSLHEIGLSLKINSKILKAIEEGNSTQLPAKTFLRGFVQSYASYLKLNVEDVLKVFTDEMGTTRPQNTIKENMTDVHKEVPRETMQNALKENSAQKKEKKTSLEESSTTKGLIFSLLGVILAGLILVTMKVIDRYQKEAQVAAVDVKPIEEEKIPLPEKVLDSKASVLTQPESVTLDKTSVVAPTLQPALPTSTAVVVNAEAVAKTTPTPALVKPIEAPKLIENVKPIEAPKVEKKILIPTKEIVKEPAKEIPKEIIKETKPIELIVEALDSVEIEYAAGSGKVEKIRLEPEQIHTFKSKAGLKLTINNGGAVNMILNGKDLGVPGDLGKPIKLTY